MKITDAIKNLALGDRMKIAVGIRNREKVDLLKPAMRYAEIVIVSPHRIDGEIEAIRSDDPVDDLISLLISGYVDGIVRGDLPAKDFKTRLPFTGERAVLMELRGSEFYMGPVGIDEGRNPENRIEMAGKLASLLEKFGIEPAIGVLSKGRLEDVGRSDEVDRSISEGELIAEKLSGMNVYHHGILIERAVKNSNIIICPDGITGNLLFRAMVLAGKAVGWGAPYIAGNVVIDTSRNSPYISNAIIHASALAKLKEMHGDIWS